MPGGALEPPGCSTFSFRGHIVPASEFILPTLQSAAGPQPLETPCRGFEAVLLPVGPGVIQLLIQAAHPNSSPSQQHTQRRAQGIGWVGADRRGVTGQSTDIPEGATPLAHTEDSQMQQPSAWAATALSTAVPSPQGQGRPRPAALTSGGSDGSFCLE